MNERIRELAEQAGFRVFRAQGLKESVPPDVFAGDGHILINTEIKKFAELIVRECAGVVAKDMDYHANWCGDKILKHFGVDETEVE